jgi:hypothetical protein
MLMHEFKLPSRVEAYAGRCKEGQQPDVSKADWKFLGYVSFAPKPGGSARELKVIQVNAVGSFFRSGAIESFISFSLCSVLLVTSAAEGCAL